MYPDDGRIPCLVLPLHLVPDAYFSPDIVTITKTTRAFDKEQSAGKECH